MSAAAPLPPPGPAVPHIMNTHAYTNGTHSNGGDGRGGSDAGGGRGSGGGYPPIAEIVASASETVEALKNHSIKHILDKGREHFNSAKISLKNRASPIAGAYWDYLVAYTLIVETIPRHRDFYEKVQGSRSQVHRDFGELVKEITTSESQFMRIKDIIKNDNMRNGAQHTRSAPTTSFVASRPSSRNGANIARRDNELMLPDVPTSPPSTQEPRRKPVVAPKPQNLHGRAVHQSSSSVSHTADLTQRFANLRGLDGTMSSRSSQDLSVKMPVPTDYHGPGRPIGPRDMPPPPLSMPPHPPKLPLNTQFAASFPKEPSPTYSPARNISGPASINPPRSTPRSMNGTGGRSNSIAASSISNFAPNANGVSGSYFPAQQQPSREQPTRARSASKTVELEIDPDKLYDYIRMFKVLLIDVRTRTDFDAGHIFASNIMCIEPETLREGYSADQLQDRLVISPEEEVGMFDRRDQYDVVVYYDESTPDVTFLSRHDRNDVETALKCLFDTLHEFNTEKPLKRPPILLKGGLDAWVDIVGPQGLKMSTTSALAVGGQTRSRALRRSPAMTHTSRINLQKRRRREFVPMDAEEEAKWREEARKGRAVVDHPELDGGQEEPESPFYRTTEDFLRRYPDVEAEQSMMYPLSRPPSGSQYVAPAIPVAPSRPAPSVPRVNYGGAHERSVSVQGRGAQPPVYFAQPRMPNIKMHRTGLMNFGVTCYMNSVLQCLSGHLLLSDLFLTGRFQTSLQKSNWKGTKGILPEAYATLLSNLYKGDINSVRPSTFRRICAHFNSQWGIDDQQDAKEFLEFVLDFLHEDLNVNWSKAPLRALSEKEELLREQFPRQYAAKIEWGRYLHRDSSVIGGMFAGQHASQLTCQSCYFTSTTYEAFWSLSLEIPNVESCDLRDCLRSYCSAERLAGDELWRCPRCKKDREAMKKITITRAPDTLVVHFKRFSASRGESARKIRTPVNFPLKTLDMGPFMEPAMTPKDEDYVVRKAHDGAAQLAELKADPTMNGPFQYNAYAVIWHIGATLGSGHYIAFVKDKSKNCWRHFNDDKVTDFDPVNLPPNNRLQNEKAYIVFYERERVAGGTF